MFFFHLLADSSNTRNWCPSPCKPTSHEIPPWKQIMSLEFPWKTPREPPWMFQWETGTKPAPRAPRVPGASRPPRSFHPSQGLGRSEWDFRQNYHGYGYVYTYMYMIVYVYIFIYSLIYVVYLSIDWFIQLFAIYSFIIFIYWFILLYIYIYISIHISMYLYIIINNCI